jgi:hypothetical protein
LTPGYSSRPLGACASGARSVQCRDGRHFLCLPLPGRVLWILALDPVPRPARAVGRAEPLRHDAFEPRSAGRGPVQSDFGPYEDQDLLCLPRGCLGDKLRPVASSPGSKALEIRCKLSKSIRCFSNMRRLASSASSSDSATSERWLVSSACLTITRWVAIWTANSAICRLACARYF